MKTKLLSFICLSLCICLILLSGCGPSLKFQTMKEQGYYPDTSDFPDTKWVCRELDMFFYMLDYSEEYMIGKYVFNDEVYRVVGRFHYSRLNFDICSDTNIFSSKYTSDFDNDTFLSCERNSVGFIYTEYLYENGVIHCTVVNADVNNGHLIPQTLTFEEEKAIAQIPDTRWHCEQVAMYIDGFSDAEGYYKGEIVIDGQKYDVRAFEVGNDNYYMFAIENGRINNSRDGTSSRFVNMIFQYDDEKIIAQITDDHITWMYGEYKHLAYKGTTLTFVQEPIS